MSDPDLTLQARLPPAVGPAIGRVLEAAREQHVADRLREADPTLWGAEGTPEVANRLGWLTIAERTLGELLEIERFADGVRHDGLRDIVLLGMGGSSLAPEVFRRAFASAGAGSKLYVLDSTDAGAIEAVGAAVEIASTLFIVSSKSGGTIEPLSLYAHFSSLNGNGSNFAAITDPGSGLAELATKQGFRQIFFGDPNIGGRYSALSAFGIVPATLIGVDTAALLRRAPSAWQAAVDDPAAAELPAAVWLGAALAALAGEGRDKLTFVIGPSLPGLGLWLEQLVAESTGKHGKGILPVADEPLGEPGEYGADRVFLHLPDPAAPDAEHAARLAALAEAGHPVITVPTSGPEDLGRIFLLAELAVAVAGWGLQINPFDQPNVQQAKDATNRVLEGYEQSGALPAIPTADDPQLRELLLGAAPPSYVALMAYLQPSEAFDAAAAELRREIRAATKATTTFGYGPRFLHSTGQFHKGGPKTGRFLQLLHDGAVDVAIPGRPYGFRTLKEAQAIGDDQTLRELGLPAERVRLEGEDPVGALRALTARIREWT
ncbi:MAG: transaldolase [Solirubrobacterales bacterium]|nr:transaldolase [Solirubrobacterales bacterium]